MSGHSKWSTIKRKKGANDAARGKVFTKLIREITAAARAGGGDPGSNPRLRTAITSAHAANMPKDNVERAIKKGTGELEGVTFLEVTYEGYAPGGVGLVIDTLTDNKTRTVAEVRHILNKYGGSMAEANAVAWNFDLRGIIQIEPGTATEDQLMEVALDAGAEDIQGDGEGFEVWTAPADLEQVRGAIADAGIAVAHAQLEKRAKTTVRVDERTAPKVLHLIELLEDLDDVQHVHSAMEITDEVLAALEA